jgi:hypothetical protein
MALIRGHHAFDDHFTQIPNDWVRDERLSLEARGLLAQIMSHRPGWNLSIKSLAARNSIGRDKVKRIMDELLAHGYLKRSEKQGHDERGHLAGYDYTTCDPGVTQEPCKAEPDKVEPAKAVKPPKKNILIEEHQTRKQSNRSADELQRLFNDFWEVYPRKRGKGAAARAYENALDKIEPDELLKKVRAFADDPWRPNDFTPLATTWLNQERWDDEPYQKPDREKTNSERNIESLRVSMALLANDDMKEVESNESSRSENVVDFGLNLRSAEDI